MIKSNILIVGLLACGMGLASCDDFLDVRPKSEKLEADLFSTPEGFEDAIYGVYGAMQSGSLYGKEMLWGLTDIMAQDFDQNTEDSRALARYEYDSNDDLKTRFSNVWSEAYTTVIAYANNVLKNLEGHSSEDLPLFNYYRGEMLAVRAFMHFDLLRLFASTDEKATGIPYSTTYSQQINEFKKVGEVYDLILADLKEAEKLLESEAEDITYPRDNSRYYKFLNYRETHCNYYAVLALTARVYWMRGNMAQAGVYAQKVIESKKYPLAKSSEIKDLLAGKLSDKETLWGLYSTSYNETVNNYLYNYQSFYSYDTYCDLSGGKHLLNYNEVYANDIQSIEQDYRLNWFKKNKTDVRCLKTVDYYKIENTAFSEWESRISGINLIHISEIYLIAAEALLKSDYERALAYFNAEITSRGLSPLLDKQLTEERIFNEYHKEMFGEGQVWYNMKRLNKDITSNCENRIIPASEDIYVIPIPQNEYDYRN